MAEMSTPEEAQAVAIERRPAGFELVTRLKELGFSLTLAAWMTFSEPPEHRLVIVSRMVETIGPKEIYDLMFRAYDGSVLPRTIDPFDVDLYGPGSDLAQNMDLQMKRATAGGAISKVDGRSFITSNLYMRPPAWLEDGGEPGADRFIIMTAPGVLAYEVDMVGGHLKQRERFRSFRKEVERRLAA